MIDSGRAIITSGNREERKEEQRITCSLSV